MSKSTKNARTGFDRFGLNEALVRGISAAGFQEPRPIQAETIPAGMEGRDVLGLAQTGTGKTAAFALPLLDRLLQGSGGAPRVLVLAPTRELANQIGVEIRMLSKFTRLKMMTIYGGVSTRGQINELKRKPDIVVGCPGRVLDLLQQGVLRLNEVETFVLDEADHMFDMGFLPDIRRIISALPSRRQNLLFSATMPKDIRHLANDLLERPHVAELADSAPAETIDHALYHVAEERKRDLLEHMLTSDECESAIVFTRTKHRAKRLAKQLSSAGHRAIGLQGNMSQNQRDRAMRGFRTRQFEILVATDIASRGIDVSGVSHVINYDVPNTPEAYTHRIGRTGRAELEGIACTFVTHADQAWVRSTERMIGSPIPRRQVEGFDAGPEPRAGGQGPASRPRGSSRGRKPAESRRRSSAPQGNRSNGKPGNDKSRGGSPKDGATRGGNPRSGRNTRNTRTRSGRGRSQ
ncbi:MAG: DEAD/DEAH box helicase [Gemmatimonadota bacterium]